METEGHSSLAEYRIQARLLLKQLRAASEAAARFRKLHSFSEKSLTQISQDAQLKHALAVIALEYGYESWTELKEAADTTASSKRFVADYKDLSASYVDDLARMMPEKLRIGWRS